MPAMTELPTGTVTFLFTDIEGSTRLLQGLGSEYERLQDQHDSIVRTAIARGGGVEIRTEGDSSVPSPCNGRAVTASHSPRA